MSFRPIFWYGRCSGSPIKRIRILESGSFLLVKSGIRKIWVQETGTPGFGIRKTAQHKESRIPLTIGILSPSFTDKDFGIQYSVIYGEESSLGSLTWGDLIQAVL